MKREYMDGILYALLFAIPAYILGLYFPIVGGPVFGILLGMLFAKKRRPQATESGIKFTGKKILQYAIILLGFEMNLFHVVEVGEQSLYVMIFTLLAAFGAAFLMGKVLGMDRDMTALVGAGTAICGGSAIAAVAPVIGAKDRDVVISIATIFFFNVLAVFIFPFLGHSWGMSDAGFGMWAGTAINDTSSVVAAGYAYSHDAGAYATIVKLTRTLMIVPVCLFFALLMMRSAAQSGVGFSLKRIFPMFVLYFVLACIVNTTGILPAEVSHGLGMLGKFSIVLAMSAIGLNTDLPSLLKHGTRPLLLGMVCWIAVAGTSLIVQHALGLL
ncbi:YeiH family protein [uncultured Selenomonas sp.]|uniref:YeiH family protein n=1 Tax=uncultured Selenomonas sp. TaxID=159275 RepID=UPI0028ECF7D9|nr:YeiH family protein [uncultured Selenomonas sp.]